MKTILHISADFPDPIQPAKTKAVERQIEATEGFRHVVYSLNRANWRSDIAMLAFAEDRFALAYGAPPYGLRLLSYLEPVASAIAADLRRRNISPDLIHAHKFTIDGVIADRLSAATGAPFIANLWGDTDSKIFEVKPGLRSHYRDVARRAAFVLPASPWTARHFSDALGLDSRRTKVMPVMTAADDIIAPRLCGKPHVVTVFGWDAWQRKGFDTLLQAIGQIAPDIPEVRLDVYGRGGAKAVLEMTKAIEKAGLGERVRLMPPLDNARVQQVMNGYAAFAMPSRRETYGMVFIEALLAGVPILWSRNQGIDGLFDNMTVGYPSNPLSADDVADGLRLLLAQEARLKAEIGRLQEQAAFEHVRRNTIVTQYRDLLTALTTMRERATSVAA
jgi:glycosyltransferase involved in cell wall biosynthesis